ncbi:MAG: CPBP family intramembrane metalloprotease [Phycisphaerae bacterium]|nr:CPBP family intramembrane metalloprotease [Phycisphaerae bacterium]
MTDDPCVTSPSPNGPAGEGTRAVNLLLFIGVFFVTWAILAKTLWYSPAKPWLDARLGKQAADVALSCLKAAIWLGTAAIFLRWRGCSDGLASLALKDHVCRGLFLGLAIGALSLAKDFIRVTHIEHREPLPLSDPAALVIMIIGAPFIEEVLFRGCILQALRQHARFGWANLAQAILFFAIHLPGWFFAGTLTTHLHPGTSLSIFVLGFFQGYLLKWTRSLWPCVLLHFANNYGARL